MSICMFDQLPYNLKQMSTMTRQCVAYMIQFCISKVKVTARSKWIIAFDQLKTSVRVIVCNQKLIFSFLLQNMLLVLQGTMSTRGF